MVFSSAIFLFIFFPIYLLTVLCVRNVRVSNALLLVLSLIFYAWGEPIYILLMLFSMLVNFLLAMPAEKLKNDSMLRHTLLSIDIVFNLTLLALFKYAGFIVTSLNSSLGLGMEVPNIPLPIGISFFTFQTMSYVVDAYRGSCGVQKNFAKFALYVSFFPQLIAGPIVKYHDIEQQLSKREINMSGIAFGLRRFIVGLSKKLLFANACGSIVDTIYAMESSDLNILLGWIAAMCYCLQIYFDFSGYSDMAIGLGKMAGFDFMENFNYPYVALSIRDFWKRWHISLTTWFREYVYIPLGGNRKGKFRTGFNRIFVFFLTGLWHGAEWTFVLWGLFHGAFMLLETYLIHPEKWKTKSISRIYTLVVVAVGFVIFRAESISQAGQMLSSMFFGFRFTPSGFSMLVQQLDFYNIVILAAAIIGATPILKNLSNVLSKRLNSSFIGALKYASCFVLLLLCMMSLASSSYNPFIYFRF